MTLSNTILVGFKEIWTHKFRSILTMLGIVLGVASLVAMAAMVKGMENGMKEAMIAMGGLDKVLVEEQKVPVFQNHLRDMAPGRTIQDVYALRQSAPLLRVVSPQMGLDRVLVSRAGKTFRPSEVVGVITETEDNEFMAVAFSSRQFPNFQVGVNESIKKHNVLF